MDSLSDIPDTPDFVHVDSLNEVSTIWDVSTTSATHDKVSRLSLVTQGERVGWGLWPELFLRSEDGMLRPELEGSCTSEAGGTISTALEARHTSHVPRRPLLDLRCCVPAVHMGTSKRDTEQAESVSLWCLSF